MLVIARRRAEKITIGSDISVVVLDVGGGRVRLGFDCPKNIPVRRDPPLDSWIPMPKIQPGAGQPALEKENETTQAPTKEKGRRKSRRPVQKVGS